MLHKILFILACVGLPVFWGVVVNSLFEFWQDRSTQNSQDESIFPDYQI